MQLFATAAGWEAKNEEEILKILIRNQKILGVSKVVCFFILFHSILKQEIKKREKKFKNKLKIGGKEDCCCWLFSWRNFVVAT